ncbi:MAG: hypothetical protein J7K40_04525 [candidate division Zixibacteria bacterium]|nr:hypothetical protein [candidate division Zixibacteria bacterium]
MNHRLLAVALFVIIIFSASDLLAVIGDWHNFTNSNDSKAIISDSLHVYCATTGGLIRYNPETEEIEKLLSSDGLGDKVLLSLETDSAGAVFAGGSNGTISKIEPDGEIKTYLFKSTTNIRYNILDLVADGDVLWVAADVGIGKFLIYMDNGGFKEIILRLGDWPSEMAVRAVKIIGDNLWAVTDSGLAYIDKDNDFPQYPPFWEIYRRGYNGLPDTGLYCMESVGDTVYIGTENGVYYLGADSLFRSSANSPSRKIYALKNLTSGLTAATNAGIFQRTGDNWEHISTDSLISQSCRGITEDRQGNIWAAFSNGGFGVYDNDYWNVLTIPGPVSNNIEDIAIDSSGNLWLAHGNNKGVTKFDGENWVNYNYTNSGIGGNAVVAVEYDVFHDLVWFTSWGDGLFSFDGDSTWVNFDETNSPLTAYLDEYISISDVAIDGRGCIWALDHRGSNPPVVMAVHNPDDSTWAVYVQDNQQISDNYQLVMHINDNNIYVGGTDVNRLNFGNNSTDTEDDIWSDIRPLVELQGGVFALAMDPYDRLYIGGEFGLVSHDTYNRTDSIYLPNEYISTVRSIAIDGLGNKWIGTDLGIVVLSTSRDDDNQKTWIDDFKNANSGLIDNAVLHIEIDKTTGFVYVGTANGLSIYESGSEAPSPDLHDMAVYPNPVNVKQGDTKIEFLRVPPDAEIYIYNTAGELVRKFLYEGRSWNLKNENNKMAAAGIYFFYARSRDKSGCGKFAIIR